MLVSTPLDVTAQAVSGVVLSAADGKPVPYGTIILGDGAGRFADAAGRFALEEPVAGAVHLRAHQIGFVPLDTTLSAGSGSQHLELRLRPIATRLAATPAERPAHGCSAPGLAEPSADVETIFEQVGENAERYRILLDQYPFHYRLEESRATRLDSQASDAQESVLAIDTAVYDSRDRHQYSVGSVVHTERTSSGAERMMMYLPTLSDLADSVFRASHCFTYGGDAAGALRIDFRPVDLIKAPDVAGSIYLDDARYIVRRTVFTLTHAGAVGGASGPVSVTTNFREEVPLVPIVVSSRIEQPLAFNKTIGMQESPLGTQGSKLAGTFNGLSPSSERRISVQQGRLLDRTFLADTVGSQGGSHASQAGAVVAVDLSCTMPPSFETADALIYGTLGGAGAVDARAGDVLTKIRPLFRMPNDFNLPVYGYAAGSKVTQTLTAQIAFTVDAAGHATNVMVTATSLAPAIDGSLVDAVQHAEYRPLKPGRYTLSLSSATPPSDARAILFARISVPVMIIARTAALDPDSTQPRLSVRGTFEFVVDEAGRAMPATLLTATASPDALTAAAHALPAFRFRPALAGSCPIKQEVMLTGLGQASQ